MVDYFTLALTHGLMALALWRLLARPELDDEASVEPRRPWVRGARDLSERAERDA